MIESLLLLLWWLLHLLLWLFKGWIKSLLLLLHLHLLLRLFKGWIESLLLHILLLLWRLLHLHLLLRLKHLRLLYILLCMIGRTCWEVPKFCIEAILHWRIITHWRSRHGSSRKWLMLKISFKSRSRLRSRRCWRLRKIGIKTSLLMLLLWWIRRWKIWLKGWYWRRCLRRRLRWHRTEISLKWRLRIIIRLWLWPKISLERIRISSRFSKSIPFCVISIAWYRSCSCWRRWLWCSSK